MIRGFRTLVMCAALLPGTGAAFAQSPTPPAPDAPRPTPMSLSSPSFTDGGIIPDKYTAASTTTPVSPALVWINAPAGTVSFTLIMHDPDTALRKGTGDVLHWLAFNIPGSVNALPENVPPVAQLPDGTIQANNISRKPGFAGPGARTVYHHYTIELYALDAKLDLTADATREQVLAAMDGHVLGKAAVEGRFHR